jgi:hypothetical protein
MEHGFVSNATKYILHENKTDSGCSMTDFAMARAWESTAHSSNAKVSTYKCADHQMVYLLIRLITLRLILVMPLTLQISNHVQEQTVIATVIW